MVQTNTPMFDIQAVSMGDRVLEWVKISAWVLFLYKL